MSILDWLSKSLSTDIIRLDILESITFPFYYIEYDIMFRSWSFSSENRTPLELHESPDNIHEKLHFMQDGKL